MQDNTPFEVMITSLTSVNVHRQSYNIQKSCIVSCINLDADIIELKRR